MKDFTCKICKEKINPKVIVDNLIPSYTFNKKQKFSYIQCPNCRIVFLNPLLHSEILKEKVYNEDYFQEDKLSFIQKIIYKLFIYKDYPQWVSEKSINHIKISVLDVGCGTGDFLQKMEKIGWDVYGTEVSEYLIKKTRKQFGEDKIFLSNSRDYEKLKVDAITLWHVLEHLEDPSTALKDLHKNLKKTGKIYIEVPNVNSLVFKLFKNTYTWLRIPDHLYYYSPETLRMLLLKGGFHDIHVWSPLKANVNFSFNVLNFCSKHNYKFGRIIFFLSIPISVIITIFASLTNRNEVIRAIASN